MLLGCYAPAPAPLGKEPVSIESKSSPSLRPAKKRVVVVVLLLLLLLLVYVERLVLNLPAPVPPGKEPVSMESKYSPSLRPAKSFVGQRRVPSFLAPVRALNRRYLGRGAPRHLKKERNKLRNVWERAIPLL